MTPGSSRNLPRPMGLAEATFAVGSALNAMGWDKGGTLETTKRGTDGVVVATRDSLTFARDFRQAFMMVGAAEALVGMKRQYYVLDKDKKDEQS